MSKHYRKQTDCLNCGANIKGKFCSNCGQENLDLHEPFWHFLGHSIGHYFHFDSKFFHTIVPLITKPGQLTLNYIEGKRTRYLQPISMFIFISIVYFLFTPLLKPRQEKEEKVVESKQIYRPEEYKKELEATPEILRSVADKSIKKQQISSFKALDSKRQTAIIDSFKTIAQKEKNPLELNQFIKELEQAKLASKSSSDTEVVELKTKDIIEKYGSKVFFILTPIFAFFLMINFRKNKKYYVEHVIYTVHFHSFAFIVLLIANFFEFILP
ncbi:DUF3667 domain-containing protein, partial [Pelobium sp.]